MPVTGCMVNVNGSASATPMGVVMPGIAPTTAPISTPRNRMPTFWNVRNSESASRRCSDTARFTHARVSKIPSGIGMPATCTKKAYRSNGTAAATAAASRQRRSPPKTISPKISATPGTTMPREGIRA